VECSKRLSLTSDFPSSNVLVRNPAGNPVRSLYLTNDLVKTVVLYNDYDRIRLISCGTKVFTKQEGGKTTDAQFRVLGEGLPVVLPYTDPNSIITADISVLKTLLEVHYPLCATFGQPFCSVIEGRGKIPAILRERCS
jgi:multisite-specific tRNA:(cytosine-C5)-methyltransferase